MKRFQDSIERSLGAQAWHSALALALCIPDICNGFEGKRGRSAYYEWFETYMPAQYQGGGINALSGQNAYALRCAYCHDGLESIEGESARDMVLDDFNLVADMSEHRRLNHLLRNDRTLQIELHCLCEDIIEGMVSWWDAVMVGNSQSLSQFEKLARFTVMS